VWRDASSNCGRRHLHPRAGTQLARTATADPAAAAPRREHMAAVLRTVGGLPFSALRLTLRLLRRIQRGPAPRHLLPVAGLDHERAAPVLFALREAAHEAEVGLGVTLQGVRLNDVTDSACAAATPRVPTAQRLLATLVAACEMFHSARGSRRGSAAGSSAGCSQSPTSISAAAPAAE
jgi:hypothetical protein